MTINKIQFKSFISPEGLQGSQNRDKYKGTSKPHTQQQLMEAQKSKDTLSYTAPDIYEGHKVENEHVYSKSQDHSTGAHSQAKNNKNLNNSKQKTAKINFRGLFNSNKVQKTIEETKAWKIAQNKFTLWLTDKAANNQAVFEALNALVITCALRPAAILAQNNDSNREKNKKAASHSIASGIIGYGFAVALFSPIAHGLKKIKNNPDIYAKKSMQYFQKIGKKEFSMETSRRFKAFTMICTYGPQLFTAAVRSAVTIAMIPVIDKHLLNPIFGTKKKNGAKYESPTKDPMYNYYYLNFSSSSKAKRAFQSFTGDMK